MKRERVVSDGIRIETQAVYIAPGIRKFTLRAAASAYAWRLISEKYPCECDEDFSCGTRATAIRTRYIGA